MPIPDPDTFRTNTSPSLNRISLRSYGGNMAKVLAALEAYWENRNGAPKIQQQLLYNLWKQSDKWLRMKQEKIDNNKGGELFARRKLNCELLRDAALEKLAEVAPQIGRALGLYQDRKGNVGKLGFENRSLSQGYERERQIYLSHGKRGGFSLSQSRIDETLRSKEGQLVNKLKTKGFGNLTVAEAQKLQQAFPDGEWNVAFMNKIARMQYFIGVDENGQFCNIEQVPLLMEGKRPFPNRTTNQHSYALAPYAMDKYGNLFVHLGKFFRNDHEYVVNEGQTNYVVMDEGRFNHSSFIAGADVLCAGGIHIGYDVKKRRPVAGVLSAIDNSSGHYKPTAQNLKNCLLALREQGVEMDAARVSDWSRGEQDIRHYWGRDFLADNDVRWPDWDLAPGGFLKAPPVFHSVA